jgi:predicted nucleotidyltransferase component of viral defense system
MLDIIKSHIRKDLSQEENINRIREFLQILILKILYDVGAFKHLAFVGGTALRIFYGLKRYSEDLDFSLIHKTGYSSLNLYKEIERQLTKNYGFKVAIKTKTT